MERRRLPMRYTNLGRRARTRARELATLIVGLPVVTSPTRSRVLQTVLGHRTVGATISPLVRIIGPGTLTIGRASFVNSGCFFDLSGDVVVGERVHIAPNVAIYTSTHRVGTHDCTAGELVTAAVGIGHGCWIGADAVILPGVTIGPGIIVGAGALVTRDLSEPGIYIGSPAVRVRGIHRC